MSNSNSQSGLTKNDTAWQQLFEEHSILEAIYKQGYFEIDSATINKLRESRLMAKFDHYANLPKIFRENNISILPISRSKYVLGRFNSYFKVQYDHTLEAIPVDFPNTIESIDYTNLYSESSALSCAFNTGIINDLMNNEDSFQTVYGRMSTGNFNFHIENIVDKTVYNIKVDNSQCEIDAGFESANYFLIVEAKLYEIDNFLIRQLYYPYRLWSNKIHNKKVIPALMTYSNSRNMFSFFVYDFEQIDNYNSIKLIEQKNYVIAPEIIIHEEISDLLKSLTIVSEPIDTPFPQADRFERVIDLITTLLDTELTKEEITANYQFDERQTNYYTDAARYLGLLSKYLNPITKEVTFRLTPEGNSLLKSRHKIKTLNLIKKILQHQAFYKTFEVTLLNGAIPPYKEICIIMSSSNLKINNTTLIRRSSTVRGWIEWILSMICDE